MLRGEGDAPRALQEEGHLVQAITGGAAARYVAARTRPPKEKGTPGRPQVLGVIARWAAALRTGVLGWGKGIWHFKKYGTQIRQQAARGEDACFRPLLTHSETPVKLLSLSEPQFLPLCNLGDALGGLQGPPGFDLHESSEIWLGLRASAEEWEGALGEAVGSLSHAWLSPGQP